MRRRKMKPKTSKNYIDSNELDQEMLKYIDTGVISERLG